MTNRDYLAHKYPLHFQRIIECIYSCPYVGLGLGVAKLDDPHLPWFDIDALFSWTYTTEGMWYWGALRGGIYDPR